MRRYQLSSHAVVRMCSRRISAEDLEIVLHLGRVVYTRGARIVALGRREIRETPALGRRADRLNGLQIVMTADGTVLTAYRNRDFRSLRGPRRPRRRV